MDEHSRLEKLQKELYSRDFPEVTNPSRQPLSTDDTEVKSGWSHDDIHPLSEQQPLSSSFFRKILIASVLFFVIALGVAGYIFYRGLNVISADNITISFLGPVSVAAGDELDFDIAVQNKNSTALANTKMYLEYPDGTKQAADVTQDLLHETNDLGDVASGDTARRTIRAVLYGKALDTKQIKVTIEYGVKNANAVFKKQATYDVQISSAPIQMTISGDNQSTSGDPFSTTITVTSTSRGVLNNVLIHTDYPFGYTFSDANPKPTYDTNGWLIKSLKPGETQSITINGVLVGQEKDVKTIHVTVGAQSLTNSKAVGTAFLSDIQTVAISRPQIESQISLNGLATNQPQIVKAGGNAGTLFIINNSPNVITNPQIVMVMTGTPLDPGSITTYSGYSNSNARSISWTVNLNPQVHDMNPGDKLALDFQFDTIDQAQAAALKNAAISFNITINGTVTDSITHLTRSVVASATKTAKVTSVLNLAANATYSTGPFKNTGPVPPKVGTKTTYTVTWILGSTINAINGATVQASLPPNVVWLNQISPSSENLTWNSNQSTVVWQVGSVQPNSAGQPRQVSFQIEYDPPLDQLGLTPPLVRDQVFQGTDASTGQVLMTNAKDISTQLTTDPKYAKQSGAVTN